MKILENPVTYAVLMVVIVIAFLLFLLFGPRPTERVVNCSLAEISPDFTPELRQQCRLLRATKL